MALSNREMEMRVHELEPYLEGKGVVAYAAARNTRILLGELTEYLNAKDALVNEMGDAELDGDGNPTGMVSITPQSERFAEFAEEIGKLMAIEHDPEVFKIKYSEVVGELTGSQILEIDWMLED